MTYDYNTLTAEQLHDVLANLERVKAERDAARDQIVLLERLIEAKEAHLDREARVATQFMRGVEVIQADTEAEQAHRLHPARTVTVDKRIIQDSINDMLKRSHGQG